MNSYTADAMYQAQTERGTQTYSAQDMETMRQQGVDVSYSRTLDTYTVTSDGMRQHHYYRSN